MGREFAKFSAKLSETFDLSEGLNADSPGVTSANFYGPNDYHTDTLNSFTSLNALSSNNTKYTIINCSTGYGGTVGTGGGASWSSGWVTSDGTNNVADGAALTFNHNLGTTDLVYNVYAAKDASGTDAIDISNHEISQTDIPREDYGSQALITNTTIQVVLGSQGLLIPNIEGVYNTSESDFATYPYIKVVVSSGAGGGGAGWSSGWVTGDGTTTLANAATLTFNHNLGTSDVVFSIYAQKSDGTVYDAYGEFTSTSDYGAGINNITDNTITITCAEKGASWINTSDGDYSGHTANWGSPDASKIKIVLSSGGGSGGGTGGGGAEWVAINQTLTNHLAGSSSNISSITDLGTGKSKINFQNAYSSATSYGVGVISSEASSSSVYVLILNAAADSFEIHNRVADSYRNAADLRVVISG